MDNETSEKRLFVTFEKHGDFVHLQSSLLDVNLFYDPSSEEDREEEILLKRLSHILDEYQEQSYLLDPLLEDLVTPVVECLKAFARKAVADRRRGSSPRVERLATLLYSFMRFRGYKTIIRFFPHEVADLSIALDFCLLQGGLAKENSQWTLRYVVLLWLSLICMIPFDLAQLDDRGSEGSTATTIETLGKTYLGKAGLEKEGAAVLLSRFYMRKDAQAHLSSFLSWTRNQLQGSPDVLMGIGLLQVLCEFTKSGPSELVQSNVSELFDLASSLDANSTLMNNTAVRKYRAKLISRLALRTLPPRHNAFVHKRSRVLGEPAVSINSASEENVDVSEYVETALEQLFEYLQDKDTIVRWSAAKGVARISERLPSDFVDQVLGTVLGLFSIHSLAAASLYDLPAIAESTWHGACLACAEMGRRGLVSPEKLPELLNWLSKALYFDLRKGAHSIGANVRDSASYAFWSLARTQESSVLAPHSEVLAQRLVSVAVFDREIPIRRAASAAFQEHVGRNNLFPHGIDVIGKTDFYGVGIRRNAFLISAPEIARHSEYGGFLMNHLLDVTLRHWDPAMRELGSQSLRLICLCDWHRLGTMALAKTSRLLESVDVADVHGGLLALCELATAHRESEAFDFDVKMQDIFDHLGRIPYEILTGTRNALVTAAACRLISSTLTPTGIESENVKSFPRWRKLIEFGLKHRDTNVQKCAAQAMSSLSALTDCSADINRYIKEIPRSTPMAQQSLGTFLGAINYRTHSTSLKPSLECLLECAKISSPITVEARRNCCSAIADIISNIATNLAEYISPAIFNALYDALTSGLADYTTDERGDVGSWVRIACMQSLTSISLVIFAHAQSIPSAVDYLPPEKYRTAMAGILKQGVERLDNVRAEAGRCCMRLLNNPPPSISQAGEWQLPGSVRMKELFNDTEEDVSWGNASRLFPRAFSLLDIEAYRAPVLAGLLLSLGSKTESTQRPAMSSLVSYTRSLPVSSQTSYDIITFAMDLVEYAKAHITSNNIVIPIIQTFNTLLMEDALDGLAVDIRGLQTLRDLRALLTRNVSRLKSVARIQETMKLAINMLTLEPLFDESTKVVGEFLAHSYPSIRKDSAENLYLFLQTVETGGETEEIEQLLLETEWTSRDVTTIKEASERTVSLLQGLLIERNA